MTCRVCALVFPIGGGVFPPRWMTLRASASRCRTVATGFPLAMRRFLDARSAWRAESRPSQRLDCRCRSTERAFRWSIVRVQSTASRCEVSRSAAQIFRGLLNRSPELFNRRWVLLGRLRTVAADDISFPFVGVACSIIGAALSRTSRACRLFGRLSEINGGLSDCHSRLSRTRGSLTTIEGGLSDGRPSLRGRANDLLREENDLFSDESHVADFEGWRRRRRVKRARSVVSSLRHIERALLQEAFVPRKRRPSDSERRFSFVRRFSCEFFHVCDRARLSK
jgi:hypothetical protein